MPIFSLSLSLCVCKKKILNTHISEKSNKKVRWVMQSMRLCPIFKRVGNGVRARSSRRKQNDMKDGDDKAEVERKIEALQRIMLEESLGLVPILSLISQSRHSPPSQWQWLRLHNFFKFFFFF
jgi:hypothetical protein